MVLWDAWEDSLLIVPGIIMRCLGKETKGRKRNRKRWFGEQPSEKKR